jgi:hypothetical protein
MKRYFIFILYVTISLIVGREFHPFSTFPMYNSFPNWGYVFFMKNEKGDMIPYGPSLSDGQKKNAGYVGHTFYSYMEQKSYPFGDGKEDPAHLHNAGEALMKMILLGEDPQKIKADTIKIYRRYYYLKNETMQYRDDMIYEQAIRP